MGDCPRPAQVASGHRPRSRHSQPVLSAIRSITAARSGWRWRKLSAAKRALMRSSFTRSPACRMPHGSSSAFHLPDQRDPVVALPPVGSGMSLRCRPQPCRRSGGQGQRLSGTAAPGFGGRPMPSSRFPLASCPPFPRERAGWLAGAPDRRFRHEYRQFQHRRVQGCGQRSVVEIGNLFKINRLDQ